MTRMDWKEHLRTFGYAQFPGLVPDALVTAAKSAIDQGLRQNYDPARQVEYDNISFCPELRGTPPIMGLLEASPALNILDEALGIDKVEWDRGQIAIRRAHNFPHEAPPEPHIDGFASGKNALEAGKVYSLTALIGVFLTPVLRPFAGNFTIWPGSHYIYESYFRERGQQSMSEPMPTPDIGQPLQLMCGVGDVVLFHYQLGHSAAVNTADTDRIVIYFRIWLRGLELNRWHYLTNIWDGWKI